MTVITEVANVNPLDPGNDANSVESAATSFDKLFSDQEPDYFEDEDPSTGQPGRSKNKAPSPRPSERKAPDPDTDDNGEADEEDEFKDPILDDTPKKEGEEDEDGDEDEDADEEGDDDDDGEIDLNKKVTVTVDGEELEVPLSEVIAGYTKDADYRQKTAALAADREEFQEFAVEVYQNSKVYTEKLQGWIDMTEALKPTQADWDSLKHSNPNLYIQTKEQWDAIEGKISEAKSEKAKAEGVQNALQARQYADWVEAENNKLVEKIPALRNPKKAAAFRQAIMAYGKATGYTKEELSQGAVDHRDIMTLYKASRYDEIMASRKSGQRPAKGAPRVSEASSQPRSVSKRSTDARKNLRNADRRLERSGSVDDAAMAFTAMFK